jgi:hypothetical protein
MFASSDSDSNLNPVFCEVSGTTPLTAQYPDRPFTESTLDSHEREPQLEISLNWFNRWKINWSCSETSWKHLTTKLKSPVSKGIATWTGIAIGVSTTAYCYSQISEVLDVNSRPDPIENSQQPSK